MFAIKMSVSDLRIDDVGWEEMFPSTHRLDILRTVLAPVRRLKLSTADDSTGYVTDTIPNVGSVLASMSCLQDLELDFRYSEFYSPRGWSLDYDEDFEMLQSSVSEIFPKQTYLPRLDRLSLFGFRGEENPLGLFSWATREDTLRAATRERQHWERKSRDHFHGDDSWKCCKRFRYAEPVSNRAND